MARFAADSAVLVEMNKYETDGLLPNPLVTVHTIFDPQVPFWHEALYLAKVAGRNRLSELVQIPIFTYGHCNISATDAELALTAHLLKTGL